MLTKANAAVLLLCTRLAFASVADKIGHFSPTDTVDRFPPQQTAQDAATRGFCQAPVQKQLRFDVAPDWEMANTICCHNTKYAEPSGYFDTNRVRLFSRFKVEEKSHTFYDSVCGIPLFTAPVGRSMAEWQAESTAHGWPSFRPAEIVEQNVVQYPNGEVRSKCGTHLGHNIPDGKGARYCIDLVCISGYPAFGVTQEPQIVKATSRSKPTARQVRRIKKVLRAAGRQSPDGRRLLQAPGARGENSKNAALGDEVRRAEHVFFHKMQRAVQGVSEGASASSGGKQARGRKLLAVGSERWPRHAGSAENALAEVTILSTPHGRSTSRPLLAELACGTGACSSNISGIARVALPGARALSSSGALLASLPRRPAALVGPTQAIRRCNASVL